MLRMRGGMLERELIDTCWDVNLFCEREVKIMEIELIDTCWDVNFLKRREFMAQQKRINRYMLGCKFGYRIYLRRQDCELIDTCWDVNFHCKILQFLLISGINRYMLGCKSYKHTSIFCCPLGINRYMLGCKYRYPINF